MPMNDCNTIVVKYIPEVKNVISGELIVPLRKQVAQMLKLAQSYAPNEANVLSASSFGAHVDCEGTKIEEWFDDAVNIEKYCIDRLNEIREINSCFHTPSAFSCIFSFIGFLAQFAGADDVELHGYLDFAVKYMRTLRCDLKNISLPDGTELIKREWSSGKKLGDQELFNTWGEVLYSLGRCGLIHSLSLEGNRDLRQNQIDLRLTHSVIDNAGIIKLYDTDVKGDEKPASVIVDDTDVKRIVINADDLCDAVYNGIVRMFQCPEAVQRAKKIMQTRPAIMAVVS